ncbi:ATP/GTP-binding protein [Pedobacter sp. N36a]|uniref:discoidin domain-containing protein n=1 Tax=Pedobacter sp. N36a TaxID=2767996 RepID=UPI00165726EC|nr:ATP/GTP-binding protein [Pedobacter sp. N36a]MBC8984565.1 ATP/GTP-binding protein [Pedobacter sp. N36a]
MDLLKLPRKAAPVLFLVAALCSSCEKQDYPKTELFTWKAKVDVTSKGKLSVNIENRDGIDSGEGSKKVVDDDVNSKFLIFSYAPNFYMQLEFPQAQQVASYSLTSGGDAPLRDPKNWTFNGSNDGSTWTVLDTRTDEAFAGRVQTRFFNFKNLNAYKYYRISITSIGAGDLFQLGEWRVIEVPEDQQ